MRLILFALFTLTSFHSFSQKRGEYIMWPYGSNDKISFAETISRPNSTTDSLYRIVKRFVLHQFTTEKDTLFADDAKHRIYCRGSFFIPVEELGERGKGYISFNMHISCYYKAVRYTITDFEHHALNPNCVYGGALENDKAAIGGVLFPRHYWEQQKSAAYYKVQSLIEQLKESINKSFPASN